MPYIADCSFRTTHTAGLIFTPAAVADEGQGELQVHFKPLKYYSAKPARRGLPPVGADFDAKITRIMIRDIHGDQKWHRLDPRDTASALAFLEANFSRDMWEAAEVETAGYFAADDESDRRAA